ncbi:hypothetical protein HPB50_019478 [Hyalomma asiaticum]|uniref:Uncharacterized protein n=1 Tax=Hyalomma asiaticum TaxID=266040 RepID=A0ACB7SJ68_HYAAI|nr:hypothetical protein HPB50_019478 [Hyalomma asiaticum]
MSRSTALPSDVSSMRNKSPAFAAEEQLPSTAGHSGARGSSGSRSSTPPVKPRLSGHRSRSRGRSKSRSVSRALSGFSVGQQRKRKSTLSWADTVSGGSGMGPSRGPRDPLPGHVRDAEVARLRKEDADLKEMVRKMAGEMTEIKILVITQSVSAKAPVPIANEVPAPASDSSGAPKRRAVCSKDESGIAAIAANEEATARANSAPGNAANEEARISDAALGSLAGGGLG